MLEKVPEGLRRFLKALEAFKRVQLASEDSKPF
jgi:hypothetical protein